MKSGKLTSEDLKAVLDENRSVKRDEVRVRSGIGEDCSVVSFGKYECVISTDPITGASNNIGKLSVNINCNDIAACGVEPLGIMVTLLAPEGTELEEIKSVMRDINEETQKINVEILGGHTEITSAVNRMVVSCSVLGRTLQGKAIATSGARIGDDIIVTKFLGMEGTAILAKDYRDKLNSIFSSEDYNEALDFLEEISAVKEGILAGKFGVNSMHDITEGGVLGALWEVAEASNKGFRVYNGAMPLKASTLKLCNELSIDPLRLISSGSMLITTDRGEELLEILKEEGIKATIIGKIIETEKILAMENTEINVTPPDRDELFKAMERLQGFEI